MRQINEIASFVFDEYSLAILIDFLGCHTRDLGIRQHIDFDLLNVSDPLILFVFADLSRRRF